MTDEVKSALDGAKGVVEKMKWEQRRDFLRENPEWLAFGAVWIAIITILAGVGVAMVMAFDTTAAELGWGLSFVGVWLLITVGLVAGAVTWDS